MRFYLLRFALFVFLSGCGYRWQIDFPTGQRPTISIPFDANDKDGTLISEIARAVIGSGVAEVRHQGGDYRLQIRILDIQNQNIGYRRDKQKVTGKIKKNIVACEGRKNIVVEATLYEGSSDRVAYGPYTVSANADYDYVDGDSIQELVFTNAAGAPTVVLPFSLGQLEAIGAAQEAVNRPLNERLAKKIVDVIFSDW